MKKPCLSCSTPTARVVLVDYPDEYGLACSEPGVPTTFSVRQALCSACAPLRILVASKFEEILAFKVEALAAAFPTAEIAAVGSFEAALHENLYDIDLVVTGTTFASFDPRSPGALTDPDGGDLVRLVRETSPLARALAVTGGLYPPAGVYDRVVIKDGPNFLDVMTAAAATLVGDAPACASCGGPQCPGYWIDPAGGRHGCGDAQ